ncbi:E3 ubiquitin-protein ligase RNF144A-like [Acipenser oxyrinchus oxyrinchus]|uniref:E3 ubiquitin-protein ligase RNF144A-like n=1 Tax=Acipenser oxyrinchus oxyrinchus TaxID=40147 RepID=A0AAD8FU32_ACIOX|nr:E3 ubiquitin-protein ligase RNF144A-like [Acipenser oxyrinchus oxyrinchus]
MNRMRARIWGLSVSTNESDPRTRLPSGLSVTASCGHSIDSLWLKWLVIKQLGLGVQDFSCQQCSQTWSWQEVKRLAVFTEQEGKSCEEMISRLNSPDPLHTHRKCPGCSLLLPRPGSGSRSVPCKACSIAKRKVFQFCWDCQQEWRAPSSQEDNDCGNKDCATQACLLSCPAIKLPGSQLDGCPCFRACPQCHALISHTLRGCSQVKCPQCAHAFCYRCLRGIKEGCLLPQLQPLGGSVGNPDIGILMMGYWGYNRCIIAARQGVTEANQVHM